MVSQLLFAGQVVFAVVLHTGSELRTAKVRPHHWAASLIQQRMAGPKLRKARLLQHKTKVGFLRRIHPGPQKFRCLACQSNPRDETQPRYEAPQVIQGHDGLAGVAEAASMHRNQPVPCRDQRGERQHSGEVKPRPRGRRDTDPRQRADHVPGTERQPVAPDVPASCSGLRRVPRQVKHRLVPVRRRQRHPVHPRRSRMAENGIRQELQVRASPGRNLPIITGQARHTDSAARDPEVRCPQPPLAEPQGPPFGEQERPVQRRRKRLRRTHPLLLPAGPRRHRTYPQTQTSPGPKRRL